MADDERQPQTLDDEHTLDDQISTPKRDEHQSQNQGTGTVTSTDTITETAQQINGTPTRPSAHGRTKSREYRELHLELQPGTLNPKGPEEGGRRPPRSARPDLPSEPRSASTSRPPSSSSNRRKSVNFQEPKKDVPSPSPLSQTKKTAPAPPKKAAIATKKVDPPKPAPVLKETPKPPPPKAAPKATKSAGMANKQNARLLKNLRIERKFLIGSEAWALDDKSRKPNTPPEHTKGWKVYVKQFPGGPDITTWLKGVQFKLHETYPNCLRPTKFAPPFEIHETGWGGFDVEIRLHFVDISEQKYGKTRHYLQLEPYGSPSQIEKQKAENFVKSEICETVYFDMPNENFYAALSSDSQFDYLKEGKKKKAIEGTEELPETRREELLGEGGEFSKQQERQIQATLMKCADDVDEEIKKELERSAAVHKELEEARRRGDIPTRRR